MALFEVSGFFQPEALIELEGIAVLQRERWRASNRGDIGVGPGLLQDDLAEEARMLFDEALACGTSTWPARLLRSTRT